MKDFVALILTNGRAGRVDTLETLREFGYTGKVLFVVDDEDKALPEYRRLYGDDVLTFSKHEIAARIDVGDNFDDRRGVVYARNASFDLAREAGYRYFIQLDDDYTGFYFRYGGRQQYGVWRAECLDDVFAKLLEFYKSVPNLLTLCISQGGDHMGGERRWQSKLEVHSTRKAMNSFLCSVDRPFSFDGRINEDTTAYTLHGRKGGLFLSCMSVQVNQRMTQQNPGGLTDLYKDTGTYVKSFYTVMFAPSCTTVSDIGSSYRRLHHKIDWPTTAVQIVHEKHRRV
jgi:hypothetical protein